MKIIQPHKEKYHALYWDIANSAAKQSVAVRRQVGAVIVPLSGIIAIGWNGSPPGFDNACELHNGKTKPEVIHAERNALDKLSKQGVSVNGSILFTTTAPCLECAKSIAGVGITHVHYRDSYHDTDGLDFLKCVGVETKKHS